MLVKVSQIEADVHPLVAACLIEAHRVTFCHE